MKVYEVLIEYSTSKLDRLFSYTYKGEKTINKLCRVIVPFAHKNICGIVIDIKETADDYQNKIGYEVKDIVDVIDEKPLLNDELFALASDIAEYYYSPKISVFLAMLPPSLKPSISSQNKPKIAYNQFVKACEGVNDDNLTIKQKELLLNIINNGTIRKSECSQNLLQQLLKKNKVTIFTVEKHRLELSNTQKQSKLILNEEQQKCFETILHDNNDIFLLEGVTGSGKTEVYLQVAEEIIKNQKKVIMLVPEISLSYQMVQRFNERFDRIAVLHSKLTLGQRYDEYRRIKNGEVDIVIGARSAIFAPLDNIGLIIIDEEHSETYKQDDQQPFYNAIEVAKMRQKYHNLKIVLGSATPSLESKSRALKGLYKQLYLTKRINNLSLPEVKIVDMTDINNIDEESVLISRPLKEAIKERLKKKEQTILLVNRRGYSP